MFCFLCYTSDYHVLKFSEEKLKDCYHMLKYRKLKNFKYRDIVLPKDCEQPSGYHKACLKKFMIMKAKYRQELQRMIENSSSSDIINKEIPSTSIHRIDTSNPTDASTLLATAMKVNVEASSVDADEEWEMGVNASRTPNSRKKCIFCDKFEKTSGKHRQYVTISVSSELSHKFLHYAELLNDEEMIDKFNAVKKIPYHPICRTVYQNKAKKAVSEPKQKGSWHIVRETHEECFKSLCAFIEGEIVEKEKILFLSTLFNRYMAIFSEINTVNGIEEIDISYASHNLQEKIVNKFQDTIKITPSKATHNKKIVYKSNINVDRFMTDFVENEDTKLQNLAYSLRNSINLTKPKKLPEHLSVDDINKGECQVPDDLFNFICDLVQSPDYRRRSSTDNLAKIKSICQDIIHCVIKSRIEPEK